MPRRRLPFAAGVEQAHRSRARLPGELGRVELAQLGERYGEPSLGVGAELAKESGDPGPQDRRPDREVGEAVERQRFGRLERRQRLLGALFAQLELGEVEAGVGDIVGLPQLLEAGQRFGQALAALLGSAAARADQREVKLGGRLAAAPAEAPHRFERPAAASRAPARRGRS